LGEVEKKLSVIWWGKERRGREGKRGEERGRKGRMVYSVKK